jgi:putative N6-adenine-specific DNA methylase
MSDIWTQRGTIALACARGLARYTRREARALGFEVVADDESSVEVVGTLRDAMRLNLWLRTAHRVLIPVARAEAKTIEHLYNHASAVPWEKWLPPDGFFTVHGTVRNDTVRDTRLPMLRVKDAIADRLRQVHGRRPDSGSGFSGAAVFILWRERDLRIFMDTTGDSLSRRGYRLWPGSAPMQETLAAACVMATGWDWHAPFVAPMCGSGTPAIEAALIAKQRAPGLLRDYFAFMALQGYAVAEPADWWVEEREAALRAARPDAEVPPIVATDHSPEAVRHARENAERAGVGRHISFACCDFAETRLPPGRGMIFMNPEYGERLGGDRARLVPTYRRIGDFLRRQATYRGGVLTASPRLAREIGLKPKKLFPFFNGPLECRLLMFDYGNDHLATAVKGKIGITAEDTVRADREGRW